MFRFLLPVGLLAGFMFLALVGGAIQDPRVVRYRVAAAGLARPVRIVQLSDSHGGPVDMPPARLARIVAAMNALKPDLVVLTGDYISGYPHQWSDAATARVLRPFRRLRAPLGVYAVLGNHDGAGPTRRGLAGTGAELLQSRRVDVGPFQLVGADDMLGAGQPVEAMRHLVRAAPPGKPVVVIAHEPDFFAGLPPRAALMIVGHTHGGQIVLPLLGPPSLSAFADRHMRGQFVEHGQTLIVSSGVGTSLLPIRFGVPPEIVAIDLVPAAALSALLDGSAAPASRRR